MHAKQPEPGGLTDELWRLARDTFDAYWVEDSKGDEREAWSDVARAIEREVLATTRKRSDEEVARIMEAADRYVTAKLFRGGPVVPDARAEVERLLKGEA